MVAAPRGRICEPCILESARTLQRQQRRDATKPLADAVCQRLRAFGDGVHWKLIETLAVDIAQMVLEDFGPRSVMVEVKKFIIPEARHVSVRVSRSK
jgi:dihydroneopterin aldolase